MHNKHNFVGCTSWNFVGYPQAQNGYRIHDISSKTIYISHDNIFPKMVFPFRDVLHSKSDHSISITPILDDCTFDYSNLTLCSTHATPIDVPTMTAVETTFPLKLKHAISDALPDVSPVSLPSMSEDNGSITSSLGSSAKRRMRPPGHLWD